jgi:hypothetical protein
MTMGKGTCFAERTRPGCGATTGRSGFPGHWTENLDVATPGLTMWAANDNLVKEGDHEIPG